MSYTFKWSIQRSRRLSCGNKELDLTRYNYSKIIVKVMLWVPMSKCIFMFSLGSCCGSRFCWCYFLLQSRVMITSGSGPTTCWLPLYKLVHILQILTKLFPHAIFFRGEVFWVKLLLVSWLPQFQAPKHNLEKLEPCYNIPKNYITIQFLWVILDPF